MVKRKPLVLSPADKQVREARERQIERELTLGACIIEASSLMSHCRIPKTITQVPDWLMPLAAYSRRFRLADRGFPAEYEHLYDAIKAGFLGDYLAVEFWCLGHEDD